MPPVRQTACCVAVAPPPALPALTSHTDILSAFPHGPLITYQELPKCLARAPDTPVVSLPLVAPNSARPTTSSESSSPTDSRRSTSPEEPPTPSTSSAAAAVRHTSQAPTRRVSFSVPSSELSESSDLSDISSSDVSSSDESSPFDSDEDEGKIRKPEGEVARPGRLGYSLREQLGWEDKNYRALQRLAQNLSADHFDERKSWSNQTLSQQNAALKEGMRMMPEVAKYEKAWPLSDVLKMRLKYISAKNRRLRRQRKLEEKLTQKVTPRTKDRAPSSRPRS